MRDNDAPFAGRTNCGVDGNGAFGVSFTACAPLVTYFGSCVNEKLIGPPFRPALLALCTFRFNAGLRAPTAEVVFGAPLIARIAENAPCAATERFAGTLGSPVF